MDRTTLLKSLRDICGRGHVITSASATRRFRQGFRVGDGACEAVVRPASLLQFWRVLQICAAARRIVILQAANTGLTGGSTPNGDDYDRPVILISVSRLKGVYLINDGTEVVCLPGASLYELERILAPFVREPHSVIGSSCIGASVVGGICNNSGGALVRRGPAFTEMALYAQIDADGQLRLVNELGIDLGTKPEEILARLDGGDHGQWRPARATGRQCSDHDYARHVRDTESAAPARFNADPRRLSGAAGCAGKVAVFAVRLDTFPSERNARTYYLGTNDPADLERLRRHILERIEALPVSAEYIHGEAFDIARRYGKDLFLAIRFLGTRRLHLLFSAKAFVDRMAGWIGLAGAQMSDRLAQFASLLFPEHLPSWLIGMRDRHEHHLILTVAEESVAELQAYRDTLGDDTQLEWHECSPGDAAAALRHRFAVAGAAVRYRAIHRKRVSGLVALDCALRRNEWDWFETLPTTMAEQLVHKLYYGHFLCHVMHQDYLIAAGCDPDTFEHGLHHLMDERGAEYPAEHNVGHVYPAKPELAAFYRALDPTNTFNPGIGNTPKAADWSTTQEPVISPL